MPKQFCYRTSSTAVWAPSRSRRVRSQAFQGKQEELASHLQRSKSAILPAARTRTHGTRVQSLTFTLRSPEPIEEG